MSRSLQTITSEDLAALPAEIHGWQGSWMQLDRGGVGYAAVHVDLDGVELNRHAVRSRVLGRWYHAEGALTLAWLERGEASARYGAKELQRDDAYFWHAGREHWFRTPPSMRLWEILVTPRIVRARGWDPAARPLVHLGAAPRARLERLCWETLQLARAEAPLATAVLRDRLLDAVERILPDALFAAAEGPIEPARRTELVRAAAEVLRTAQPLSGVRIGPLANSLGVAERTLYAAFREQVGMGPYEFARLERLHDFRRRLHAGSAFHGKVGESARGAGFGDVKRAGRVYRSWFHETPRETLRRLS